MILVTGGAGYIGSHVVRMLLKRGYKVVIFDNLSRGHIESVPEGIPFENVDLCDYDSLIKAVKKYPIESAIHFAAFAYVGESVENPALYYSNNVLGSFNLIKVLNECGIKRIVFSSTCSVYGNPLKVPISEEQISAPINPYAKTKLIIEYILKDFDESYGMKYAALRYFNAAGDSDDGEIGESHDSEPHLIPLVLFTALGKRDKLFVYGDDYETKDGTCIRDYIHVNDLADAHIRALEYIKEKNESITVNLGTGDGYSVKEIIQTAEEVTGMKIKFDITQRRAGDPAVLVADNSKAKKLLGWVPKYDLKKIMQTAFNWHKDQKY